MLYDPLLLEALPYPATLIDAEGLIVDVNRAFLEMARQLGREIHKEDRVGYPVEQFTATTEERQQLRALLENVRRHGTPQRCRWGWAAADGTVVHRQLEIRPLQEAGGPLTGALLLWEELRAPRWQEQQRAARERLREACWQLQRPADIPPLLQTLYQELKALFPQLEHCSVQVIEEDTGQWEAYAVSAAQTRRQERREAPGAAVDLCWREQRPVYRPDLTQEDPYGEAAALWDEWGFLGVRAVLDVPFAQGTLAVHSGRPQAFAAEEIAALSELAYGLAAGLARLAELQSQARYRALVETPADTMVMYLGLDGRYLYVSPQSTALTGYPPEAFYADPALGRQLAHPEEWEAGEQAFRRVAAGGPEEHRELRVGDQTGGYRWRRETLSPIYDAAGHLDAVQAIFRDIDEQVRLQTQRTAEQAQKEAVQATRERLQEAFGQLRHAGDIPVALKVLYQELKRRYPQLRNCSLQVRQADDGTWITYAVTPTRVVDVSLRQSHGGEHGKAVETCWREQRPIYRPDVTAEDLYGEAAYFREHAPEVRSVLDVPFAQGTLALNSLQPQAFRAEEIATLGELAPLVSAGFAHLAEVRSAARYRLLVESPADLVVMHRTLEGRYLYVSPQITPLAGYPPEALYADPARGQRLVHPDQLEAVQQAFGRVAAGGPQERRETRIRHQDGTERWILHTLSPLRDAGGPLEGVQELWQDITEHQQAEAALRRRLHYEHLLSAISARAVQVEDGEAFQEECLRRLGPGLSVSRAYLFAQREATEVMDNTHEWCAEGIPPHKDALQGIPSQELSWWVGTLRRGEEIAYADIEEIPDPVAKEILRPQGIRSLLVVPLFVQDRYVGFMGFDDCVRHRRWEAEDVALLRAIGRIIASVLERQQAEVEREKLQGQLIQAQKMESVGRLAGGVAHDYNNMLGVILGYTQMALKRLDPADPLHADLEEIRQAAQRSVELTRQLLAFARRQTIAPRIIELNETVEGMLKMLRRLLGEDLELVWRPGRQVGPVKLDPAQLDQVLANLCVNARDAIAGVGQVILETDNVTFDAAYGAVHAGFVPGDFVMLAVSDSGCGMDRETLEQVFEPFFTTKEVGQGTGLGLATVYGIVKQNQGFINVYSEPGQGTTIKLYWPRVAGEQATAPAAGPAAAPPRGSGTVLVVEDEVRLLRLAQTMLESLGYTVLAASTPEAALRRAEEHVGTLELLLTDVVMPQMNGRQLAERLRRHRPGLKWLFMSGYTANLIAHHGVLDEGVPFLQKPFSLEALAIKVQAVLQGTSE